MTWDQIASLYQGRWSAFAANWGESGMVASDNFSGSCLDEWGCWVHKRSRNVAWRVTSLSIGDPPKYKFFFFKQKSLILFIWKSEWWVWGCEERITHPLGHFPSVYNSQFWVRQKSWTWNWTNSRLLCGWLGLEVLGYFLLYSRAH